MICREMTAADVCVYKRKRSTSGKSALFYYAVKDPVTGAYLDSRKSVAALAKKMGFPLSDKMNKSDARHIVDLAIKNGVISYGNERKETAEDALLIPFVERICTFETSPWVAMEKRRKGTCNSKRYVDNLLRAFRLHAKPVIPDDMLLTSLSRKDALDIQSRMHERNVSPNNINAAMKALRTAYNYAVQQDMVKENPLIAVKPFIIEAPERDILSRTETLEVLGIMEQHACESICRMGAYLGAKLAVFSGMREGEIRAMSISQLSPVLNEDGKGTGYVKIRVDRAWDESMKCIGETKGRYKRTTVITQELAEELIDFAKDTGKGADDLLFRATRSSDNHRSDNAPYPMVKNTFQKYIYEAVYEIGISKEKRTERGITFHALRHFYDSQMKAEALRMEKYHSEIRAAVGHRSKAVDELIYTHDTSANLIALGVMSEHLLDI